MHRHEESGPGGGYRVSDEWKPLGLAGLYGIFGPEISFAATLEQELEGNLALAKFTHSGSQIVDWTPAGSEATSRNLYPEFHRFVRKSMRQLEGRGQKVELAGIFYHLDENDMPWGPSRSQASLRLQSFVSQSRKDLGLPPSGQTTRPEHPRRRGAGRSWLTNR